MCYLIVCFYVLIFLIFFPFPKASRILGSGDDCERNELIEAEGDSSDGSLRDRYLGQAADLFSSGCKKGVMIFSSLFSLLVIISINMVNMSMHTHFCSFLM